MRHFVHNRNNDKFQFNHNKDAATGCGHHAVNSSSWAYLRAERKCNASPHTAVIHVLTHDSCAQECPPVGLMRLFECWWLRGVVLLLLLYIFNVPCVRRLNDEIAGDERNRRPVLERLTAAVLVSGPGYSSSSMPQHEIWGRLHHEIDLVMA